MLLQKYLQTIEGIDPGKIFVENVRSAYNLSRYDARLICEMAVEENLFVKRIGLVCPGEFCNQRIIADYPTFETIPEFITCAICEAHEAKQSTYRTNDLKKIEFYQVKK